MQKKIKKALKKRKINKAGGACGSPGCVESETMDWALKNKTEPVWFN